jgi:pyruvate dehydrogenase E1 component alpha subunit
VLYVCENNLYGIGTRIDRSTAVVDQYQRVSGYNIPSAQEDGQDVERVYKAATKAIKHVRSGKGPYFLELMTYRYRGHSMSDSNAYRAKDEERMWSGRDPVIMLRDRLIDAGTLTLEEFKDMDTEILDEIEDDVIRFAVESPEPPVSEVEKYVLAENDPWVRGGVQ